MYVTTEYIRHIGGSVSKGEEAFRGRCLQYKLHSMKKERRGSLRSEAGRFLVSHYFASKGP